MTAQDRPSPAEALQLFDSLPAATLDELIGRWRGAGYHTGHPLDGLLEAFGWYGKSFIDCDAVDPLLFRGRGGKVFAINPAAIPVGFAVRHTALLHSSLARAAFIVSRPFLRTRKPRARIRMMAHRGVVSATMIYDDLPILDVYRRVDRDTVLGLMDLRGMPQPFFFMLRREADHSGQGR